MFSEQVVAGHSAEFYFYMWSGHHLLFVYSLSHSSARTLQQRPITQKSLQWPTKALHKLAPSSPLASSPPLVPALHSIHTGFFAVPEYARPSPKALMA